MKCDQPFFFHQHSCTCLISSYVYFLYTRPIVRNLQTFPLSVQILLWVQIFPIHFPKYQQRNLKAQLVWFSLLFEAFLRHKTFLCKFVGRKIETTYHIWPSFCRSIYVCADHWRPISINLLIPCQYQEIFLLAFSKFQLKRMQYHPHEPNGLALLLETPIGL